MCTCVVLGVGKICLIFMLWIFVQGTASVVLAGLMAALKLVGGTLAEHKFLFLGAGEVCPS